MNGENEKPVVKRCAADVAHGYRSRPCGVRASVEREGHWYCKRHDPVAKAARDAKRHEEWEAKYKERLAAFRDQQDAPALRARIVALETENRRLREALENIANYEWWMEQQEKVRKENPRSFVYEMHLLRRNVKDHARRALQGDQNVQGT